MSVEPDTTVATFEERLRIAQEKIYQRFDEYTETQAKLAIRFVATAGSDQKEYETNRKRISEQYERDNEALSNEWTAIKKEMEAVTGMIGDDNERTN